MLHACGTRDYEALRARLGPDPPANYDLREFITPFGEALLASDLCVARAGGSIFEIAAHGRPAILVPYPHASADHQSSNARWMAQAGAAVVVADAELTPARLAERGRTRCWAIARGWRRWDGRRRRWRGPTPLSGSPRRCSPRRGDRAERSAAAFSSPSQARLSA